ncbi:MAG: hypothetical protein Q7J57_15155 [Gemmobacter sp.]|nr:hypothetical protein [Gemmobacter sp.]
MTGATPSGLTRRTFVLGSGVAVVVAVLPVHAQLAGRAAKSQMPGSADQRIDGLAKVTGQKVYARDFRARDMPGWPAGEWQALYLNSTTTSRAFLGLDLSGLPPEAQPRVVIYGDMLTGVQRAPVLALSRDLHLEGRTTQAASTTSIGVAEGAGSTNSAAFDRPSAVMFDLIVQRGNRPDFLGQSVALLLFDDAQTFRAASRALQFRPEVQT